MKVLGILCISLFYPWCIHLELADKGYFFTHYSNTVPRRNVLSAVSAVFSSCGQKCITEGCRERSLDVAFNDSSLDVIGLPD